MAAGCVARGGIESPEDLLELAGGAVTGELTYR
jgi:hypothetical protein